MDMPVDAERKQEPESSSTDRMQTPRPNCQARRSAEKNESASERGCLPLSSKPWKWAHGDKSVCQGAQTQKTNAVLEVVWREKSKSNTRMHPSGCRYESGVANDRLVIQQNPANPDTQSRMCAVDHWRSAAKQSTFDQGMPTKSQSGPTRAIASKLNKLHTPMCTGSPQRRRPSVEGGMHVSHGGVVIIMGRSSNAIARELVVFSARSVHSQLKTARQRSLCCW